MSMIYGQIIGYDVSKRGASVSRASNPATGELLPGDFNHATDEEILEAVSLAKSAASSLKHLSPQEKSNSIQRIAREIESQSQQIVARCHEESGLPVARLEGEVGRTTGQLRMFAELVREGSWVDARIDRAIPQREPLPRPDIRRMSIPIGPVAVFCASNFPLAFSVAGVDTAAALAAGNPVIVKAHHAHPGTAALVGAAVQTACRLSKLPAGTFALLHGPGSQLGMTLVKHPDIKAVGFTGSQGGGRALFDAAASRPEPIPVYAEMASINPVFVLPSALEDPSRLAAQHHQSLILGTGQFCTNPGIVVLLESPGAHAFIERLAKLLADTPPGVMLHKGIRSAYAGGVKRLEVTPNVRMLTDCDLSDAGPGDAHAKPTVFQTEAKTFLLESALRQEVFGPCALAVLCEDKGEMLEVAGSFRGELTASLHGNVEEIRNAGELVSILEDRVGRIVFNGFPTGVEVVPAMNHGGPYPATTDVHFTSVGTATIHRYSRPICYQGCPDDRLPDALKNDNPLGIWRTVDGELTKKAIET